ncbi:hypothetical protein [Candidatus Phytoplasma asteris]|uniref:hypothetical protein n=1 Tax=Candidatus Phytoplasma asteris TaxID=85620 RepID=UPI00313386FC
MQQPTHKQKEKNTKSLLNPELQQQIEKIIQQEKEKQKILETEKGYLNINLQAQQLEKLSLEGKIIELQSQLKTKETTLQQTKDLSDEEKNKLQSEIEVIKNNITNQNELIVKKDNELILSKEKITTLEKQLASNIKDVNQLKTEIEQKQTELEIKEQKLIDQKNLSTNEIKQLNVEINNLRSNIEKSQINYQAQLLLKEEEIKQLKQNEDKLKQQLTQKQEETTNLREQHLKTLEEIQKQIANYKNMVSELEQETNNLKEQIAKNNENANKLREELLTKQTQINKINQELVSLSNQQISLQQELNNLTQPLDEWEKNCEIKANEIASNLDLKNVKRVIDQKIYYSTEPFTIELKPFNPYQPQKNENKQTINSLEIKINNVKYYYIQFDFHSNFFYIKDKDLNVIHRIYNTTKSPTDWMFQFSHNVSETPPPTKLNNYKSILQQKTNELSEITQKITKKQQELNK